MEELKLPRDFSRCSGKHEQGLLQEQCEDCLRYIERGVENTYMFFVPPVQLGMKCVFKLGEMK